MRNRWIALIVGLFTLLLIGIVATLTLAPDSTGINLLNSNGGQATCLTDLNGDCLVMPGVSGLDANSDTVTFPEQFEADYHLVVMPFDRDQQVLAVTWLPLFQEIAAEYDNLQYWSIAALPELNAGLRFLVISGISIGISDDTVRPQVTALFMEEQQLFMDVLEIDSTDVIQSFIMDSDGVVYYRSTGEYSEEKGAEFRNAVDALLQ